MKAIKSPNKQKNEYFAREMKESLRKLYRAASSFKKRELDVLATLLSATSK